MASDFSINFPFSPLFFVSPSRIMMIICWFNAVKFRRCTCDVSVLQFKRLRIPRSKSGEFVCHWSRNRAVRLFLTEFLSLWIKYNCINRSVWSYVLFELVSSRSIQYFPPFDRLFYSSAPDILVKRSFDCIRISK